jgi:hypothetical protein
MRQVLVLAIAILTTSVGYAQKGKVLTAADFASATPKCTNNKASFTVQVGSGLPSYQIPLVQDPVSAEIATVHHAGRIEVSQAGTLLETIEVNSIWNDSLCNYFEMKDVNFDGDLDIAVLRDAGGKWARHDYYMFDRTKSMFVADSLTEDLAQVQSSGLILDAEAGQIRAPFFKGRCAGVDTYKIENNRLEKVEEQEITPRGDECGITVRESVHGTWEVVRSSRTLDMSDPGF